MKSRNAPTAASDRLPVTREYRGRFAPSPTGPLHLGSLVTALASYLDARAHRGRWLIRLEDIDPPREQPGSALQILRTLEIHGMVSDEPVLYQSRRLQAYQGCIEQLQRQGLVFRCECSRHQLRHHPVYPGTCRGASVVCSEAALRLKVDERDIVFDDLIRGSQRWPMRVSVGDFVVRRRDGLFAYQLAVAVDDAFQGISRVVRGGDLLDSTARQIYLQQCLGFPAPDYAHVPVLVNAQGRKLSKQTGAAAVDDTRPGSNLWEALVVLGHHPPAGLRCADVAEILDWGVDSWSLGRLPVGAEIALSSEQPAVFLG